MGDCCAPPPKAIIIPSRNIVLKGLSMSRVVINFVIIATGFCVDIHTATSDFCRSIIHTD